MNQEQQLAWDLLSNNHARLTHIWGQELQELSKNQGHRQFHARADECLCRTLSWPIDARSRAVKTWLSTYKLPLEPAQLPSFGRFHQTTGHFVFNNAQSIQAYD